MTEVVAMGDTVHAVHNLGMRLYELPALGQQLAHLTYMSWGYPDLRYQISSQ